MTLSVLFHKNNKSFFDCYSKKYFNIHELGGNTVMDFILSNEQRLIQKMMREFTENEVKPVAAELDLKHEYPA